MKKIQKLFFALGTVNSIIITCEDSKENIMSAVLEQIKNRILEMDDKLSVFKEGSEISRIRKSAGKDIVEVSEDTYFIVKKSLEYAEFSAGTFDITSRPLSELWGIGKKGDYIPSLNEIKNISKLVNYKDIIMKESPYRIGLRRKGQALDLGGVAKGFAADFTREILSDYPIKEAVINFGGTVIAMGAEKIIGIQNPEMVTGKTMGSLTIENQAVVTSGVYERYFRKDGIRYHHIIDLLTGRPSDSGLCSATVIGASAMEMDALATTVLLLGMKEGMKLMDRCQAEGIFITDAKEVYVTPGIANKFKMTDQQENRYGK